MLVKKQTLKNNHKNDKVFYYKFSSIIVAVVLYLFPEKKNLQHP